MAWVGALLSRNFDSGERLRLAGFFGGVGLLHIVGWGLLVAFGLHDPALLALGGLAYTFGLRHAFDADHISAIDNTTRKLLQQGKRPVGVGFFFSLGHSTVVLLIALALGLAVQVIVEGVVNDDGQLREVGGLVGTTVSGTFLILIGIVNLIVLLDIVGAFRKLRDGAYDAQQLEQEVVAGGLLTRAFARLFRIVTASWHMYPIGFLFGLGFDTASEVALLAISAGAASQGLPFFAVVSLPLIFAAGMTLMDTTDGAFMAKAYSWAFSNPVRKVFYNLSVTGLSVFVALFVGVVELLQVLIGQLRLEGQPWAAIGALNFANMGFIIVGAFVVVWLGAFTVYRVRRVEERWGAALESAG